jgi:hypothetical protein
MLALGYEAMRAQGSEVPTELRDYLIEVLIYGGRPPKKRGPKPKRDDFTRTPDEAIIFLVGWAMKKHGLKATRNRESRGPGASPSACSHVARILGMPEHTVERIWGRRPQN